MVQARFEMFLIVRWMYTLAAATPMRSDAVSWSGRHGAAKPIENTNKQGIQQMTRFTRFQGHL